MLINNITIRSVKAKCNYILSGIFYKIVLDFSYWSFISPNYSFMYLNWKPDTIKYFESSVLYVVLLLFSRHEIKKSSDFFIAFLLFLFIAPILSFYGLADQSRYALYIVLLGYILVEVFRQGRPLSLPFFKDGPQIALILMIGGIALASVWLVLAGGLNFWNLDFTKVYTFREMARTELNFGLWGYINNWTWNVFGPALIGIALWRKQYFYVSILCLLHLFWFGVSSNKGVLFTPLLPLFAWWFFKKSRSIYWIPIVTGTVILLFTIVSVTFDSRSPAHLIPRRTHFVPARITFHYYNFFDSQPKIWWSSSSVSLGFVKNPYRMNPAKVIGNEYYGGSHANNSFLSTGYMHGGVYGIILYGIIVGILFRFIDSLSKNRLPLWLSISILFKPFYTLSVSSDLFTALSTKGILISLLILSLVRNWGNQSNIENNKNVISCSL